MTDFKCGRQNHVASYLGCKLGVSIPTLRIDLSLSCFHIWILRTNKPDKSLACQVKGANTNLIHLQTEFELQRWHILPKI